jgi:phenylpyruvate tautomerase PptA (4-oxalocrotonate tautomerase family)
MPFVRIDVVGPKTPEYKRALLSGTRAAITDVFGVADGRVAVRVVETPAEDVDLPSCRTERLTTLDVLMFEGRSDEMKAAMVEAVRGRLSSDPGIEPSEVVVSFREATPADLHVLPGEAAH